MAEEYLVLCSNYKVTPDVSVLCSLTTDSKSIVVSSISVLDSSILAILQSLGKRDIRELYVGHRSMVCSLGDGNWLCRSIAFTQSLFNNLRVLDLQRLGIDGRGVRELAMCASSFRALVTLNLRYNYIGYLNGETQMERFLLSGPSTLRMLDLSCNCLTYHAIKRMRQAAIIRYGQVICHVNPFETEEQLDDLLEEALVDEKDSSSPTTASSPTRKTNCCSKKLSLLVEGNFFIEEVWNSVTHGLGVLLAIIGTVNLLSIVKDRSTETWSACLIYGLSAILLFCASTLYHSFFQLSTAKYVFQILDHCSIFILIAGSNTPMCALSSHLLPPGHATTATAIEWIMCFFGIGLHTVSLHWPKWARSTAYTLIESSVYIAMGSLVVVMWEPLMMRASLSAQVYMIISGVLYMGGFSFYLWDYLHVLPMMHCIWHIFVLGAAISHFFSIRAMATSWSGDQVSQVTF